MEKNNLGDWDVKICPLRSKQCLRTQCAWWLQEYKACSVTKIAESEIKG
ncbi:MAG: hypothetical protein HQ558_06590 [Candidatus Omnitrophica bacterium]|nr:hypothetical protein [Candidatus Omnitrophota bacterium]